MVDSRVTCGSCGFLGKDSEIGGTGRPAHPLLLLSMERSSGFFDVVSPEGKNATGYPVCYMDRTIFPAVLDVVSGSRAGTVWETIGEELARERICSDWIPYQEHRSPQWHEDDRRMRQYEELRRDTTLKLAELESRSQEETRAILSELRDIAAVTKSVSDAAQKQTHWFNWAFAVLALAALVLAVAGLIAPDGIPGLTIENHSVLELQPVATPTP